MCLFYLYFFFRGYFALCIPLIVRFPRRSAVKKAKQNNNARDLHVKWDGRIFPIKSGRTPRGEQVPANLSHERKQFKDLD